MTRYLAMLLLFALDAASADGRVPAYLLQLPEGMSDVFVADTGSATLYHYRNSNDGVTLAGESYMSIGQNGVGKMREWDRRTPLGIYFVVDRLDTSRLHEKYGVIAFPLDYPNTRDRQEGRSGNGIWVHGVHPGGERRPELDTDGCIALPNEDLARLQDAFVPSSTPVVVTRSIRWASAEDRERITRELREAVTSWAHAYAAADPAAYLALYDSGFSYRGMNREEWLAFRENAIRSRGAAAIALGNLLLLADPEEPGVYLSRFDQRTIAGDAQFETVKRLYWKRGADGLLKIIAEDNG